jgi:hypothetical protein
LRTVLDPSVPPNNTSNFLLHPSSSWTNTDGQCLRGLPADYRELLCDAGGKGGRRVRLHKAAKCRDRIKVQSHDYFR